MQNHATLSDITFMNSRMIVINCFWPSERSAVSASASTELIVATPAAAVDCARRVVMYVCVFKVAEVCVFRGVGKGGVRREGEPSDL